MRCTVLPLTPAVSGGNYEGSWPISVGDSWVFWRQSFDVTHQDKTLSVSIPFRRAVPFDHALTQCSRCHACVMPKIEWISKWSWTSGSQIVKQNKTIRPLLFQGKNFKIHSETKTKATLRQKKKKKRCLGNHGSGWRPKMFPHSNTSENTRA